VSFGGPPCGYQPGEMAAVSTSELRIPADPAYIVVAKRAAAGFGCVAGFGVEAIDDLVIAVAQACQNAIDVVTRAGDRGRGQIRLGFKLEDRRLEVQVRSVCAREGDADAPCGSDPAGDSRRVSAERGAAVQRDLALRVMGLFVDDCRYRVDERTGGLRVRLTKYRLG
jgi:anti-sigma regulatory factor (Ser/Thr protein kinase)